MSEQTHRSQSSGATHGSDSSTPLIKSGGPSPLQSPGPPPPVDRRPESEGLPCPSVKPAHASHETSPRLPDHDRNSFMSVGARKGVQPPGGDGIKDDQRSASKLIF